MAARALVFAAVCALPGSACKNMGGVGCGAFFQKTIFTVWLGTFEHVLSPFILFWKMSLPRGKRQHDDAEPASPGAEPPAPIRSSSRRRVQTNSFTYSAGQVRSRPEPFRGEEPEAETAPPSDLSPPAPMPSADGLCPMQRFLGAAVWERAQAHTRAPLLSQQPVRTQQPQPTPATKTRSRISKIAVAGEKFMALAADAQRHRMNRKHADAATAHAAMMVVTPAGVFCSLFAHRPLPTPCLVCVRTQPLPPMPLTRTPPPLAGEVPPACVHNPC